jgi:hypothetical protein
MVLQVYRVAAFHAMTDFFLAFSAALINLLGHLGT